MTHKLENWIFHEDYFDPTMPKSIQNIVKRQLNNSKRMPIDDIEQVHPVIENKLAAASVSYMKKIQQSRDYAQKKVSLKSKANNVVGVQDPHFDSHDELNDLLSDMKKEYI